MAVFIDTGAFMAYRNKKDIYHRAANGLVRRALKGEFGLIFTSDYIYDETLTLAMVRTGNKDVIKDISDVMLSSHIEMFIIDVVILEEARDLFFQLFDKRISFTDASTMVVMQQENIGKIITFDSHFNGMFEVLNE
ncbi:MAG: PIN domain-containing protein [ANME-2 cluster archaeon]|jgi:predicted nucleic acid-binding protein|nr:PIN domain-containing protein [ANME-2 cluster archaeon]